MSAARRNSWSTRGPLKSRSLTVVGSERAVHGGKKADFRIRRKVLNSLLVNHPAIH